ncbi:MAG: hypothetical protein JW910_04050 [Anaerolineae bacterium]|nr:hypothetical protein [Anaerolineae bacterium]
MPELISLVGIGCGAVLTLLGLGLIAPQVRRHQIRVYSAGSLVFRLGMALALIGVLVLRNRTYELSVTGLLVGITGLLGGAFVWNHERAQALQLAELRGQAHWDWTSSLTLQMILLGGLVIVGAVLVR